MTDLNLLVVDDDELVRESIQISLPDQWRLTAVENEKQIPNKIFQAALIDMHLTGQLDQAEGIKVIEKLRKTDAHLDIVAMSGNLDRELMEKCLKAGASRFLAKPLSIDELNLTLDKIEALLLLQGATGRGQMRQQQWIGQSKASQQVQKQIAELRGEAGPILIEGESGTGKEVAARLIHSQGAGPFISINIAALPENLFESEIFGHVKGSFTGADQNKMGLAEAAHGGDLFIDEIEALPMSLQVKLLRFLESGEIRRVGGKDAIMVQTRVITASNRDLSKMVEAGEFREDLLWRISGKKINLPPLRERKADLKDLAYHFFKQDPVRKKELTPEALQVMQDYSWPGNVRELKRFCEQMLLKAPLPVIRADDVLAQLQPQTQVASALTIDYQKGLPDLLAEHEAFIISSCLDKFNDVDEVARLLKISRSSLYKKVKDHAIQWRD